MSEEKACLIMLVDVLLLFVALLLAAGLLHDNAVTRARVDSMGESIAEMQKAQERQASQIRQVYADSTIMLRLEAGGEYMEGEK